MDSRLLRYYNRELKHLQDTAGEFSKEFPKVAGRLGLDGFECADPYVERLLQGFAFLAARVQLKLDAEFPRFTQHLLDTVYPHYLCPTPSMTVVNFEPDMSEGALAEGFTVPRGSVLRSMMGKGDRTPCEYRTAQDVTLWPLKIAEAQYYSRELGVLNLPNRGAAQAAIRIRIKSTPQIPLDKIPLERLRFYLRGSDEIPMRIYEQVFSHCTAVIVRPPQQPAPWYEKLSPKSVQRVGFADEEALLPQQPRSFAGYRLIQEYFAFPQRFMFFQINDLQQAMARCGEGQTELDIIIMLRQVDLELEHVVDPAKFALFATPAVNLFPKRADRIHLSDRFSEFHVVPDRTRPLDFEVYQVREVTGLGARSDDVQEFLPFYSARDEDSHGAYFALNRVPRTLSAKEARTGRRSSYAGSEVYISLVDANSAPYRSELRQLAVTTLCTNRDLPLRMPIGQGQTDLSMEVGAPVKSVRCLTTPTPPRPSHAEGETAWRIISHLSLNYLSLTNNDEHEGAAALRDLMRLYSNMAEPHIRKQIEGLKSVSHRAVTRRLSLTGPITFARGLEVSVTFDETAFEGTGVFLLGAVLERFFAKYVALNSFTETVVRTVERGEIMRWPVKLGQSQLL